MTAKSLETAFRRALRRRILPPAPESVKTVSQQIREINEAFLKAKPKS